MMIRDFGSSYINASVLQNIMRQLFSRNCKEIRRKHKSSRCAATLKMNRNV